MSSYQNLLRVLDQLKALKCWYVSTGGAVGSTFELALGSKVKREIPLENTNQSSEFRKFEGEAGILIWCAWRLRRSKPKRGSDLILASWDDGSRRVSEALNHLVGAKIKSVALVNLAWDLHINFDNGLQLDVFCDHVSDEASFDGNWDAWTQTHEVYAGPGDAVEMKPILDAAQPVVLKRKAG